MPTLDVATPFTVSMDPVLPDGTPRDPALPTTYVFPYPGKYDVDDEVAQHWMTPPNLVGYEPPTLAEAAGVVIMVPIEEPPPEGGGGDTMGGGLSRGGEIRPGGIGTATGGAAAGRTRVGPPAGATANAAPPAPPAAPPTPPAPPAKPAA